jgi:hypothetical protein
VIAGIHPEVWMAAGYALFLAAVAAGLEMVARQSHKRSEGLQLSGFKYYQEHDAWECPTGQRLGRFETDYKLHIVRYRAIGHICNCCHIKKDCTDSDDGRTIERPLDSWLRSEIRLFHRGISLALVVLAVLILLAEIVHFEQPRELLVLGGFLVPIGVFGAKIASDFRSEKSEDSSRPI